MIRFPTNVEDATGHSGATIRAGATDLHELRRAGIVSGSIVDLRDLPGLDRIAEASGGGLAVGARVTVARVADDERVRTGWPGLAQAAGALATPQIREVATVAGNLLQRVRCWYFRAPHVQCLKKGGDTCFARGGDHLYHSCFDLGPCVAVHPSTLGMALLAYDANVVVVGQGAGTFAVADLLGDGADPRREHRLEPGALVTSIELPPAAARERAAYVRTISRKRAEWPLVEAMARLIVKDDGTIESAAIAVGGVAPIPLRRPEVERALVGKPGGDDTFAAAAKAAREGSKPLPMTGYKVDLLEATVLDALERAWKPDAQAPKPKEAQP